MGKIYNIGVTGAQQLAVVDNLGLVYAQVRRFSRLPWHDGDDLFGAACLAFCRAVESWDPGRSLLTTWAWRCIRYAILDELKRLARRLAPLPAVILAPVLAGPPYERVTRYLAVCTLSERCVVALRFGLDGSPRMGLKRIGRRLGWRRAEVAGEFDRAMARMRREADDDLRGQDVL